MGLSRMFKVGKEKAIKGITKAAKTAKDQPFSLAATALATAADLAQDVHAFRRHQAGARAPLSSLLKASSTMTQGWQNATAARKRNEKSKKATAILDADTDGNGNKIKTADKVQALFALGEDKLANNLLKLHGVKKTLKYKKKQFGETKRMNDFTVGNEDRKFNKSVEDTKFEHDYKNKTFDKSVKDTEFDQNFRNRTFDQNESHFQTGRTDKQGNALINAFGQVLKGTGNPQQLIEMVKNPSLVAGVNGKKGIPFLSGKSIKINKPEYIPEKSGNQVIKKIFSKLGI